jgi:hypothetical protein
MQTSQGPQGETHPGGIDRAICAISQHIVKVGASIIVNLSVGVQVEELEHVSLHGPFSFHNDTDDSNFRDVPLF